MFYIDILWFISDLAGICVENTVELLPLVQVNSIRSYIKSVFDKALENKVTYLEPKP